MKALLFTDSDTFAGTERHIFDLACALRDSNPSGDNIAVSIGVACPVPSPLATRCREVGIRVLNVPKQGFIGWNAVRILRRELKSRRVEVIHAHNGRTALAAALAVFLARRGRLVTTQHFMAPNHTTQNGIKAKVSSLAHRWVTKQTHTVIAISQAVRNAVLERYETTAEKMTVVFNGIPDIALGNAPNRATEAAGDVRNNFDVGERFFVLCAARLEKEKNVATLIDAMKIVTEAHPHVLCLIAGEGSLQGELQTRIKNLSLSDSVRLLGFRDDVLSLMKSCDIFVLPSVAEPFGLVLIEAMAFGKPVIATCAGGPLEIVDEGISGFLVAPSSASSLAEALLKLLHNETLRATMGGAARERYEEKFTARRMALEIAAVYNKLYNSDVRVLV